MNEYQYVLAFQAGATRANVNFLTRLKGVRAISLRQYCYSGLGAGQTASFILKFSDQIECDQANSLAVPGYMFPVVFRDAGMNQVIYGTPQLITKLMVPQLTSLRCEVTQSNGAAAVFTELIMWLTIHYDDDHTDLDVVRQEQQLYEVVRGQNNWRHPYTKSRAEGDATAARLKSGVFSSWNQ